MTILRKGFGKHSGRVEIAKYDDQFVAVISLGKRKRAIISLSDLDILNEHSFYAHQRNDGLYVARSSQTGAYLHRIIMQPMQGQEIDHINADPLDNCRGNLRPCSTRQNNLAKKKETVAGYHGIHCTREPIDIDDEDVQFQRVGIYKAISPEGKLEGKFTDPRKAAELRDELMVDEYFHREGEEEAFHPFAFIEWNDDDVHPDVSAAITEMEDWLFDETQEAQYQSCLILEENNWTASEYRK